MSHAYIIRMHFRASIAKWMLLACLPAVFIGRPH